MYKMMWVTLFQNSTELQVGYSRVFINIKMS